MMGLNTLQKEPVQYPTSNGEKQEFPMKAFPWSILHLMEESQKSLGYYPEHLGSAILFAASVAIGNTVRIQVKYGWKENTTLFIALVGSPGTAKSHALSMALKPLESAEKKLLKEYLMQQSDYDSATEKGQKPTLKQYLVSDATVEGLCLAHTHNLRGLGLVRDELAGWIKDFNKYRAGSDEQFWLSNWSGKPIKVNRKTQDVISIFNPKIDVCGTIQPGILNELSKDSRTKNGFLDRILFAYPDKFEVSKWNENELSESVTTDYENIIHKLMRLQPVQDDKQEFQPLLAVYSDDAKKIFTDWFNDNADKKADVSTPEYLRNSYAKLDIYVSRFALILQLLYWAADEDTQHHEISTKAINAAIDLVEYYRATFGKVYESISEGDTPTITKKVLELQSKGFTYDQIEKITGVPRSTAQYWVKKNK